MASLSTGGKVIVVSTPNGYDQIYYEIYDQSLRNMNDFKISEMFWYRDPRYTKDLYMVKTNDLVHFLLNREEYSEKDIIKLVERYGFRIIYLEDLNVKDQISLFNNAKIIIAPHGAGIINFAYCSNPFRLLEIYPPNYLDSSFRILAQVLKCDYHYLISETKEISNIDPQKENIHVNCKKLEKWLKKFA
jgi:hypothetical protein